MDFHTATCRQLCWNPVKFAGQLPRCTGTGGSFMLANWAVRLHSRRLAGRSNPESHRIYFFRLLGMVAWRCAYYWPLPSSSQWNKLCGYAWRTHHLPTFCAFVSSFRGSQVERVVPNVAVSVLQTVPWCLLLSLIGDSCMQSLLLDFSLFIPCHGGSLFQVFQSPDKTFTL